MMRAALKSINPRELVIGEIGKPTLNQDEVLIRVDYCGVCGSDLHAFNHSKGYEFVKKPIILGHEFSGTIVDSYDASLHDLIGKQVIVEPMQYCGECENCKKGRKSICDKNKVIGLHYNGGMAEFVKVNKRYVREIPEGLLSKYAALCEPMSIAVHAVDSIANVQKDEIVLVQGPGIIGFFVSLICKQRGAKVILSGLERDYESRLSKCEDFGIIPHTADREKLETKVDLFIECSGANAAITYGFQHLKKGGRAVVVALFEQPTSLFLTDLVRNEWSILTSYGSDPEDFEVSIDLLVNFSESLEKLISIYSIESAEKAFMDGLEKRVLKPLLIINS